MRARTPSTPLSRRRRHGCGSAEAKRPWRALCPPAPGLGIDFVFEELEGKEHWWWDTHKSNDGGAVNDPPLRKFFAAAMQAPPQTPADFVLTVINPAAVGSKRGLRVMQQLVPYQTATVRVRVQVTAEGEGGGGGAHVWEVSTANVRRLAVDVGTAQGLPATARLRVDGQLFSAARLAASTQRSGDVKSRLGNLLAFVGLSSRC